MSSDSVPMDYQHPEWSPRAMKVAGSARLLLMMLEGVELPRLADKEAKRLKERLTLLEEVSCGGEPDFIHKALRRTLTSPTTQPPSSESGMEE